MSDQTEKPKGALPKGYDANTTSTENTPSTEVVKQKKINFLELVRYTSTDQDQREKDLEEYEASYIARLEKNKPEESSDDFRVELGISTESDVDLGRLNLRKHVNAKRKAKQDEIKEYEKKYLARYKKPKAKSKRSFSLKSDIDMGTLTLSQYINAKRKAKQEEIKEYEKKYLARYKKPKAKPTKSSNLKSDVDLGRLNLRKHAVTKRREYLAKRKEYEEKYILRYMAKLETKPKKSSSKKLDHDLISGRLNLREQIDKKRKELQAERKSYEKKYLVRYKEPKAKQKKSSNLKSDDDLGRLNFRKHAVTELEKLRAERKEYEQKYLARYNKQQKTKRSKKK